MNRAWATSNAVLNEAKQVCPNPTEGDDRAQEVALALAAISDVDFLRSVLNAKAAMDQWGGEYTVAAKRERIDAHGRINPEGAERVTIAYAHFYNHVADVLKEEREPNRKPHQLEWDNGNGDGPEQPPEDEPDPMEAEIARAAAAAEDPGDPGEADHQAEREAAAEPTA